jgi:hypothetical protein
VVVFNVSEQNLRYSWFEHRASNHSNTTGATSRAGTDYPFGKPEFILGFNEVRLARSLVICVVFCRSLFVLLFFFAWPLCCLSFYDLQILINPLVSSDSSSTQ